MEIQPIDEKLMAALHQHAKESERNRTNFDLRTTPEDTSQRMLNVMEPGTNVPIHRHLETSETIVGLEGCLDIVFFEGEPDTDFKEVARYRICPREKQYGIQIPPMTWHSVEVYEPSTIFEAMDGKYIG